MGRSSKGGGSTTVGYRYYMSLHMALCRGPIDEIVQINVGDIRAWPVPDGDADTDSGLALIAQGPNNTGVALYEDGSSNTTSAGAVNTYNGPSNGSISMDAANLFGGDKKEGGISGAMSVLMGASTQVIPSYIKALLGGRVPEFRGVVTLFFDGLICALNPYPKQWAFRVRRTVSGWDGDVWEPTLATIWLANNTIKAMNPAHIIYECLTNRDWGRGLPRAAINAPAFKAAAQTLFNEKMGLCIRWNRQNELSDFVQDIIDHIGGSLYTDRTNGLLTLDLLRADYDIDALPTFDYDSGLISIEDDETASRDDLVNEVIINWHDPIKNEDRQARLHNLASLQSLGATKSTTTTYAGFPTADLAARAGQRDIRANTTSLKRFKVILDRRGSKIIPGKVFKISAPDKNIQSVVLRAGKVSKPGGTDGQITIDTVLDVFGLPAASFISQQPTIWTPPDRTALIPEHRYFREATYSDLVRGMSPADLAIIDVNSGGITTMAAKPSELSQSYTVATRVSSEAFVKRGASPFAPFATVSATVGFYDTTIFFTGGIDLGIVEVGIPIQIGDEICRLDNIVSEDGQSGTITVGRGCTDTLPTGHAIGTAIYFFDEDVGTDGREYVIGETVDIKLLSVTSTQELSPDVAPIDNVVISARQGRPWAPGNMRVNGSPYATAPAILGDITLTWAHRDRTLIQDQLIEHGAASIGPEAGTTYTIRAYATLTDTIVKRTVTGLTAATWTYTAAQMAADGINTTVVFEIDTVRNGIQSQGKYRFLVNRQ